MVAAVLALATIGCGSTSSPTPVEVGWRPPIAGVGHAQVEGGVRSDDGAVLAIRLCVPDGAGPWAAVVFHFGSDRWGRLTCQATAGWWSLGIATVTYDKRGTGASQGHCCPYQDPDYFPLLAADVVAIARMAATWPTIDPARLGAYGFSQGGWVIPVAAASAPEAIRWTIIGSGPAVSLGEELRYSDLTGDSACQPSGRSAESIDSTLDREGPSGFDPLPAIRAMQRPAIWVYGGLDTSIPVARSVRNLEAVVRERQSPFTIVTVPNINHSWVVGGGMCQLTGTRWDDSVVLVPWLRGVGVVP